MAGGAILKAGRGVFRTHRLPKLIADKQKELDKPVLGEFRDGIQRFEAAELLLDAKLAKRLDEASDGQRKRVFEQYLDALEQEFQMAKDELEQEVASRADVVALGVAMKQMAFSYDQELEAFNAKKREEFDDLGRVKREVESLSDQLTRKHRSRLDELEKKFRTWTEEHRKESEEKLKTWTDEYTAALVADFDQQVEEFEERIGKYLAERSRKIRDFLDETEADAKARVDEKLDGLDDRFTSRLSNAEEELQQLSGALPRLEAEGQKAASEREELSKREADLRNLVQEQEQALADGRSRILWLTAVSVVAILVALGSLGMSLQV